MKISGGGAFVITLAVMDIVYYLVAWILKLLSADTAELDGGSR